MSTLKGFLKDGVQTTQTTPKSEESNDSSSEETVDLQKELWDSAAVDPVLATKMALINRSLDEIGMTPCQWKLFCLNGFGYAVDSVSEVHIRGRAVDKTDRTSFSSLRNR